MSTANGYGNDQLTIQAHVFSSNVKIKWLFNSYPALLSESKEAEFCKQFLYFQTEQSNIINYINSCCCNNITTASCTWDVVNSNEYKFAWLSSKQVLISVYCCVQGAVYNAKRPVFASRSITFYYVLHLIISTGNTRLNTTLCEQTLVMWAVNVSHQDLIILVL